MRVGISGTRSNATQEQLHTLRTVLSMLSGNIEVHHGMCIGVDEAAHNIVRSEQPTAVIVGHPPTNSKHEAQLDVDVLCDRKPYLERNDDIAHACDVLLAVPAQDEEQLRSGTWSTVRRARKYDKQCIIITRNGSTRFDE